jgi:hypothetical protein
MAPLAHRAQPANIGCGQIIVMEMRRGQHHLAARHGMWLAVLGAAVGIGWAALAAVAGTAEHSGP